MPWKKLVCKLKGHLWQAVGNTPNPSGGHYIVHRNCFRCGKYQRLTREAVSFRVKE